MRKIRNKVTKANIFLFIILFFLNLACTHNDELERVLDYADNNRTELEKVLTHYEKDTNPLKLKAAQYLILNMPYHRSYIGESISEYYREIEHILDSDKPNKTKKEEIEELSQKYPINKFQTEEDLKFITSDYLIKNIEHAFSKWENNYWASHINFEQFCEYILPYKYMDYQQLDDWRNSLSSRFSFLEDGPENDQSANSVYFIAEQINKEIFARSKDLIKLPEYIQLRNSSIDKLHYVDCYGSSLLAVAVMRSLGIPVMMDHIPNWGRKEARHAWHTLLSDNGQYLPFSFGLTSKAGDVFFPYEPMPKIYRRSYKRNKKIEEYLKNGLYKHPNFNLFDQDVTQEYMETSDLSIPLLNETIKDKYVYLALFDNHQWQLVDLGTITKGKAEFSKVGRNILYLVFGYNGIDLIPISNPFILRKDGSTEILHTDTVNTEYISLKRKYPKTFFLSEIESRIVGGEIQASNDDKFNTYETFYRIENMNYPDLIPIQSDKKYRYWRFNIDKDEYCCLAELQFYMQGSDSIAKGRIIGTEDIYQNMFDVMGREKAFDGDWLTFSHTATRTGGWIGLDFEEPVLIDRVRCVTRSDDNGIHYDEDYELKYWGEKEWISLGKQKAKDKILYFDSVPSNSLLWLQNHTRGKQERIFIYRNGKQEFW